MENPNLTPPIASPFGGGTPQPLPPQTPGDWANAPKIVKGWAYPLTWLGIIGLPIVILLTIVGSKDPIETNIEVFLYLILFGVQVWLNRGIRKGTRAAWVGQICLSALGILGFPVGTLIHGNILSQWFKPETKAWFGRT